MDNKLTTMKKELKKFFTDLCGSANKLSDDKTLSKTQVSLDFGEIDKRPLVKDLGQWIESEGYLFFDQFRIPHPVGFKAELGYRPYAEQLVNMAEHLDKVESLFDVAITSVGSLINDRDKLNGKSSRLPRLDKLENGMVSDDLVKPFSEYFEKDRTKDSDVFTVLFKNAHDLNVTALTIETLLGMAGESRAVKLTNKISRLSKLILLLRDELENNSDKPHKDILADIRESYIIPLSFWAESVGIFLYQVNVLKVNFVEVETKIKKKIK